MFTANFPVFKWEEDCASRSRAVDLSSIPANSGASSNWGSCVDQSIGSHRLGGCCCCCGFELFLERERDIHTSVHTPCVCVLTSFLGVFQQWDLGWPQSWENAIIIMLVPPRKRKQVQTMNTTSCAIGQLWIHSFLRVYTEKICCKLSQLGFWGVWKGREMPLPTHHCWYRNFFYFLIFCSNLHSFFLWAFSSGF